jgi:DNA invertase Pin-like site-specific DNA recombinase
MPQKTISPTQKQLALCYVRQSSHRGDNFARQKAAITQICEQYGWHMAWYEDTTARRPAWAELQQRLTDPNVTALVVSDVTRLHRSQQQLDDLLAHLAECDVTLIAAATA